MSPITTHILDTTLGIPARGVPIQLFKLDGAGSPVELARGLTNDDGRIRDLLPEGALTVGVYQMRFDTEGYFTSIDRTGFYPEVVITFTLREVDSHYHIPLLLSPYGYSTYRGS